MTTWFHPGLGCSCKVPCPADVGPCTCIDSDTFDNMPSEVREAIMQLYRAARDGRKLTRYEVGHIVCAVVNAKPSWCPYDGCGGSDDSHPLLSHFDEWLCGNC